MTEAEESSKGTIEVPRRILLELLTRVVELLKIVREEAKR